MHDDRGPRPDQFLHDALAIHTPKVREPDPAKDLGMYNRMNKAFEGLHDYLEQWRRNYGRLGYGSANLMSDYSKELIEAIRYGDSEEDISYMMLAMEKLSDGFNDAVKDEALPDEVTRFGSTVDQEQLEAQLFAKIWPVIVGDSAGVPELLSWRDFKGNLQAYLYGFLDVVSELSKAVTDELFDHEYGTDEELNIYRRYVAIAESIVLRLGQERHIPGYVINNGYGRWMSYSTKLRRAQGAIAYVKRDCIVAKRAKRLESMVEEAASRVVNSK